MDGLVHPDVEAINALRCRLVVTWTELAARAGVSSVTLARLKRGDALAVRTVRRIAEGLGVEPSGIIVVPGNPATHQSVAAPSAACG